MSIEGGITSHYSKLITHYFHINMDNIDDDCKVHPYFYRVIQLSSCKSFLRKFLQRGYTKTALGIFVPF